jgi:hypothetical protein
MKGKANMEQNKRIPRQEYPAQPPMNPVHPPANPQPLPNPPAAYPSLAYSLATVAVAEQLAQWQTTFETARPITYSTIDDGNYIAQITDVSFRVERGIPWMVYELMICDAMEEENKQCIGMTIEKRRKLENDPRSMGYLKGELEVCGVRIQRASEIPQHFAAMRGIVLGIRKTTSGKYSNIYLNHQIDPETGTPITHRR